MILLVEVGKVAKPFLYELCSCVRHFSLLPNGLSSKARTSTIIRVFAVRGTQKASFSNWPNTPDEIVVKSEKTTEKQTMRFMENAVKVKISNSMKFNLITHGA